MGPINEALTFDDVTLVPKYSSVLPSDVQTETFLSNNLQLKIPLITSAMDTVTEAKMAIAIAKAGGIGVIHRNLSIKKQIIESDRGPDTIFNAVGKVFKLTADEKGFLKAGGNVSDFVDVRRIKPVTDAFLKTSTD